MAEKGLVKPGRIFVRPRLSGADSPGTDEQTLVADLLERAFEGSTSRLLLQALATQKATKAELAESAKS